MTPGTEERGAETCHGDVCGKGREPADQQPDDRDRDDEAHSERRTELGDDARRHYDGVALAHRGVDRVDALLVGAAQRLPILRHEAEDHREDTGDRHEAQESQKAPQGETRPPRR